MSVLVTGASGFIGRYVVDALLGRHYSVVAYDRHRVDWPEGVLSVNGDVGDVGALQAAVQQSSGVIHLAGLLGTAELIDDPWRAIEVNVGGAINVFDACRRFELPCVYITVGNHWMHSPYPITKTAAESLAWMYNREHGTRIAVVRALSTYGPGQKVAPVRKIIPSFIRQALTGQPLTVYGDGYQAVDLVWVGDVADILVRALLEDHDCYLAQPRLPASVPPRFDAATGRGMRVNEVARAVLKVVGGGEIEHVPMRPGEPARAVVVGNPFTLRPLYGGALPMMSHFEDRLPETVEWYRQHLAIGKAPEIVYTA